MGEYRKNGSEHRAVDAVSLNQAHRRVQYLGRGEGRGLNGGLTADILQVKMATSKCKMAASS